MATYPGDTWTRTNTNNVTVVDEDYMDASDDEITAIEQSLGKDLVPGTTAPLVDSLRVKAVSSVNHVFLAHDEQADARVSVGPLDLSGSVAAPSGKLHVRSGASGVTTVSPDADDLVVENNDNAGITILAPNTEHCSLFMSTGTGGQPLRALVQYRSTPKRMDIGTSVADGVLRFLSANEQPAMELGADKKATFKGDRIRIETIHTKDSIGSGMEGDVALAKDGPGDYYIFVSDGTIWNGVKLTETSN